MFLPVTPQFASLKNLDCFSSYSGSRPIPTNRDPMGIWSNKEQFKIRSEKRIHLNWQISQWKYKKLFPFGSLEENLLGAPNIATAKFDLTRNALRISMFVISILTFARDSIYNRMKELNSKWSNLTFSNAEINYLLFYTNKSCCTRFSSM